MTSAELVHIDLPADELRLLTWGLTQWGGPAHCTDAMAVAMGFESAETMLGDIRVMRSTVESSGSLAPHDWTRALIAIEVVFASDVVGAAHDWTIVTGWTDEYSIRVLRRLQGSLRNARARFI